MNFLEKRQLHYKRILITDIEYLKLIDPYKPNTWEHIQGSNNNPLKSSI